MTQGTSLLQTSRPGGLRITHGGRSVLRRVAAGLGEPQELSEATCDAELSSATPAVEVEATSAAVGLPLDDLLGTTVGRFHIESELSAHTAGATFLARHTMFDLQAVVWATDVQQAGVDATLLQQRIDTVRAAARVRHAQVQRVWGYEMRQGVFLLITEHTDGMPLVDLMAQERRIPEQRALTMLQGVAEGLAAGFDKGVIHGGVCPEHIFVTERSKVKLVDFCWYIHQAGLSPLADDPTLAYRAPECLTTSALDHRADIYALGAVLYQMLLGHLPRPATRAQARMQGHEHPTIPAPHTVDATLSTLTSDLVMAMLTPDPTRRLNHYSELLRRLHHILLGQPKVRARQASK